MSAGTVEAVRKALGLIRRRTGDLLRIFVGVD
jgi:hypothetical protein